MKYKDPDNNVYEIEEKFKHLLPKNSVKITEAEATDLLALIPVDPKALRNSALNGLIHDFDDGRIMQTRPIDESNIRNAIEVMEANNIPAIDWVMKDNIKYPVTVAELKAALSAGQLAAMAIWDAYNP